jgi:hypothetical protein
MMPRIDVRKKARKVIRQEEVVDATDIEGNH